MPTILRLGPYRFFFYSADRAEPPHVHVERDGGEAKFWLDPVTMEYGKGLRRHELMEIESRVQEHQQRMLEQWHEYFDN